MYIAIPNNASSEADTDFKWTDLIANNGNARQYQDFGTRVSAMDGSIEWKFTDLIIPQNGPDIVISRSLSGDQAARVTGTSLPIYTPTEIFDWSLDIPKIHLNYWQIADSVISECGAGGTKTLQVSVDEVGGFDPIGLDRDNISYPEATVVHFANNWILKCSEYTSRSNSYDHIGKSISKAVTQGVSLKSPQGTVYYFAIEFSAISRFRHTLMAMPRSWDVTAVRTLYVTDIEDKHGNWLTFDYKEAVSKNSYYDYVDGIQKSKLLLTSVRSKEGTSVSLSNDGNNITGLTYGDYSVTYIPEDKVYSFPSYNKTILSQAVQGSGTEKETWTYVHTEFGNPTDLGTYPSRGLTQIRNPWGGVVDFKYAAKLFACSRNHADWPLSSVRLSEMTVSGLGLSPYSVNYKVNRNETDEPTIRPLSDFAYTTITYPDRKEIHKYHCKEFVPNSEVGPEFYRDTPDIRDYRYKSIRIYNNNEQLVRKTEFEWHEQTLEHLLDKDAYKWYDPNGANRLVQKKVTIDGEYETNYSQFNRFGSAQHIHEKHISMNRSKYHKKSFLNDQSKWLIGLPTSYSVSADNSVYTEVNLVKYHGDTLGNSSYKGLGLPYEIHQFGSRVKSYVSYHGNGKQHEVTNANNVKRTLDNYKRGKPRSVGISGVLGATTSVINDDGTVKSVTDHNANKYELGYDSLGRLSNVTFPLEDGIQYWQGVDITYDKVNGDDTAITGAGLVAGQWKKTITHGNNRRTEYFDGLWRTVLTKEEDLSNPENTRYIKREFDESHREVFISQPSLLANENKGVATEYDALGRLDKTINRTSVDRVTEYKYLSGNRKQVTDARYNTTTYTYQAFGQPSYSVVAKIESPEDVTTTIDRDVFGKINWIKQAGGGISSTRYYYYDNREKLCRIYNPETGYTAMYYDNAELLKWKLVGTNTNYCNQSAAPSGATQFSYTPRGAIDYIDYPSGTSDLDFGYDNNGNTKFAIRGSTRWDYEYNSLNQLEAESLSLDGRSFGLSYGYDGRGSLNWTSYPSGRIVDFMPNAFGQATQAGSFASNIEYVPSGSMSQLTYGNGQVYNMIPNQRQFPEQIKVGNLVHLHYQYDDTGNIYTIVDYKNSGENRVLTYDGLDRLDTASGPWGASNFNYDSLGNITFKQVGSKSYTYNYDRTKNRLTGVTGSKTYNFEYDSQGNIKSNGFHSLTFDRANLMLSANDSTLANYEYDANKKRVYTVQSGRKIYNIYSKSGKLSHKFDLSKNEPSDYIYVTGIQIAKINGIPGAQSPVSPAYLTLPESNNSGSYSVSWPTVDGATSYTLQERKGSGNWVTIYNGSTTSKNLTGKVTDTYQYRVKSCASAGCSQYRESRFIEVNSNIGGSQTPGVPGNLSAPSSDTDGKFAVTWGAVVNATTYQVQRKVGSGSWVTKPANTLRTYLENTSMPGTYYYRVRACNSYGCSGYSAAVSTMVYIVLPPPVCDPFRACKRGL